MKFSYLILMVSFVYSHVNLHEDEVYNMKHEYDIDDFDERTFFVMHDKNKDNYLTPDELKTIYLSENDGETSPEQADEIVSYVLSEVDKNNDGRVSFEEFLAASAGHEDDHERTHLETNSHLHAGSHEDHRQKVYNTEHWENIPDKFRVMEQHS
jgi:hypothetical protein